MQKALAGGKLHTRAEMQSPVLEYLALLSATLLGAALRLYRLGDWSFWADEVFTLGLKEDGFNFSLWRQSFAGGMIRMVTGWLGTSEWSARLAPALIGILTLPVLYFFLKRALGTFPALAATALLAVSPWHLYWSQNARFYTLLLLFYSLALLLFLHWLRGGSPAFCVAVVGVPWPGGARAPAGVVFLARGGGVPGVSARLPLSAAARLPAEEYCPVLCAFALAGGLLCRSLRGQLARVAFRVWLGEQ